MKCSDFYNEETEQAIQESYDILSGKIPAKRYNSAAEMIADILAEDDNEEIAKIERA